MNKSFSDRQEGNGILEEGQGKPNLCADTTTKAQKLLRQDSRKLDQVGQGNQR